MTKHNLRIDYIIIYHFYINKKNLFNGESTFIFTAKLKTHFCSVKIYFRCTLHSAYQFIFNKMCVLEINAFYCSSVAAHEF